MAEMLRDGTGKGFLGKINGNNRLYTQAVIVSEDQQATKKGRSYNLNTGVITLTNSADTPVMYVKNNESIPLHITAIAVGLGPSTDGSGGIPKITVVRNPTAGTIIDTTPTDIDINSNRNFSSSSTLNITAYKGATGDTMTDGTDHIIFFQNSSGRLFATIDEILDTGASIGIKIDPQPSNTSQDVYTALIGHLEDENE
jgi:hypothetical protein